MDFATVLQPAGYFDWIIANGDLGSDDGLDTAVAISLFSDRLANADDVLPDNSGDRRGWWGDAYLPALADGTPDHIGSRLWLLTRALQIPATALAAQAYCEEALQWLINDGAVGAVTVPLPTFPARGLMTITVILSQRNSAGVSVDRRFGFLWDMTRGTPSGSAIVSDSEGVLGAPAPVLRSFDSDWDLDFGC